MNDDPVISGPLGGRCLCGAVSFTASNVQPRYHVCHCGMCRRWNGGPSMTIIAGAVEFEGGDHIAVYDSSDWAQRAFCRHCGSNLYYRFKQSSDWFLWAGLFDDQSQFELGSEIYIDTKPAGYSFSGDHPRLTEREFLQSIGIDPPPD